MRYRRQSRAAQRTVVWSLFPPFESFVRDLAHAMQRAGNDPVVLITALMLIARLLVAVPRFALSNRVLCGALSGHSAIAQVCRQGNLNTETL